MIPQDSTEANDPNQQPEQTVRVISPALSAHPDKTNSSDVHLRNTPEMYWFTVKWRNRPLD